MYARRRLLEILVARLRDSDMLVLWAIGGQSPERLLERLGDQQAVLNPSEGESGHHLRRTRRESVGPLPLPRSSIPSPLPAEKLSSAARWLWAAAHSFDQADPLLGPFSTLRNAYPETACQEASRAAPKAQLSGPTRQPGGTIASQPIRSARSSPGSASACFERVDNLRTAEVRSLWRLSREQSILILNCSGWSRPSIPLTVL